MENAGVRAKASTCETAAGAKQGRTKGNNTGKLSTQNWKKRMRNQPGRKGKSQRNERTEEHRGAAVRRTGKKAEKKNRMLSNRKQGKSGRKKAKAERKKEEGKHESAERKA